jgi:hypothetical protein
MTSFEERVLLSFIRGIHDMVGIPKGAVFQSRLYGYEGFEEVDTLQGVTIKFPCDEEDCLRYNPDRSFASKYVEVMSIRSTLDVPVYEISTTLRLGQVICVPKKRGWTFLEDMGYVKILNIPGKVLTVVGSDAKSAFLGATAPNLRLVEVMSDIGMEKLVSLGILPDSDREDFEYISNADIKRDVTTEQSWRYSSYLDYDNPKMVLRGRAERNLYEDTHVTDDIHNDDFGIMELDY